MSTPVTVRQREEAKAKNAIKQEQRNRQQQKQQQQQQPTFSSNYYNTHGPSTYQIQPLFTYQQQHRNIDFSEDAPINNFDWDDWTNNRQVAIPPQPSQVQRIIYKNITINKDNVFLFHGKDSCMSTFFEAPFTLRNHIYPNVETYYEACKLYCLVHYSCSTMVQKAKNAAGAKMIAKDIIRKQNIPRKVIDAWKVREGSQAVYNATQAKFEQNPNLKQLLLETGDNLIIQCYEKDKIFGSGCSQKELEQWIEKNNGKVIRVPLGPQIEAGKAPRIGKGQNLLGYFCMAIREQLRQSEININAFQSLSLL